MNNWKSWQRPLIICAMLTVFFTYIYYADNKYEEPPPYGNSGVISLNEGHLNRECPVFLIDGWLLSDERITDRPTYIGEFSNLQRGDYTISPHGWASYRLTLRYEGNPRLAAIEFPQLSSSYIISLNGTPLERGKGNATVSFLLTPGDHMLTVETLSRLGYYSGMYFPPSLGTPDTLAKTDRFRSFFYALAFLLPLSLSAFTMILWRTGGELNRFFGLLCCCYSLYVVRYFVFLFQLFVTPYWFFAENLSFYGLCYCVVSLTALAAETDSKTVRRIHGIMLLLPCILLTLCLLIPVLPQAVVMHGYLTDFYYILTFCFAAFFAARSSMIQSWESRFTLTGCTIFGLGLLLNLFFSNRFEPVLFLWQFEWCGLLLVLLFAAMMISRNNRILLENEQLTNHLEQMVSARTKEVVQLLEERKAFFSDLAHDLKAPVFATQSFIEAIRQGGLGIDTELRGLLDRAEGKQREMARRLQGLTTIHALDKIESEKTKISICDFLKEVYEDHHGEAEVLAIHLELKQPKTDAFIYAQPEKLRILFENLIYNALKATPKEGTITISAQISNQMVQIAVSDTGCGISSDELSLIFRRFYVGQKNKETGTGLGLYIVKIIVEELGGSIHAESSVGEGSCFTIELPLLLS